MKIEPKKTALILPGAGARGRFQAGSLKAIREYQVKYDMLFGTSSGALNGALFHQGDLDILIDLWTNIKNSDVYRPQPWHLLGRDKYIFDTTPLAKLLARLVKPGMAKVPYFVSATDAQTLMSHTFLYDIFGLEDRREVLRASAALPLLFPPVQLWNRQFVDGGLGRNMPLTRALANGAKRLIVLQPAPTASAGKEDSLIDEFARIIGMFEQGVSQAEIESVHNAKKLDPEIELILVQPEDNPPNGLLDFCLKVAESKKIIDEGYELAREILKLAGY